LEYYEKNKADYASVDYCIMYIAAEQSLIEDEALRTAENEEFLKEAKLKADTMLAAVATRSDFAREARKYASEAEKENYEDEEYTVRTGAKKASLSELFSTWFFDGERKSLDKTVLEGPSGYYVVLLLKPMYKDDYNLVSMNHILIMPAEAEDDHDYDDEDEEHAEYDEDQAWEDAHERIVDIQNEWIAAGKSLEKFEELASKYTDDTASAESGGYYGNITKKYMVPEIDEWLFNVARKPGDYEIISTTYGYHLVYFNSVNDVAWIKDVSEGMKFDDFDAKLETELKKNPTKINSLGFTFVKNK